MRLTRTNYKDNSSSTNKRNDQPVTINIFDIHPVELDGAILSSGDLDLLHGSNSLSTNDDKLFDKIDVLNEAEFVIADFDVNGTTHQAHVWTVNDDGSLTKWGRGSVDSSSGLQSDFERDIVVVGVPPGVGVPTAPAPTGPPAPGTTQKKIRVKIGKRGSLPFQ